MVARCNICSAVAIEQEEFRGNVCFEAFEEEINNQCRIRPVRWTRQRGILYARRRSHKISKFHAGVIGAQDYVESSNFHSG